MEKTKIIDAKAGKIQGIKEEGIEIFKGIPYTERIVGDLRFKPPIPAKRFPGVFLATEFGPVCPQIISPKLINHPYPQSEPDCLTLNIWTPSSDKDKRPVMVWIHGGGLRSHDARSYDGKFLVKRGNVVIVSLNYRLNALGFSFIPGIVTAPLGLLDQITALKWVRDNIENFGGDPNNVTIFGESAGGWSVSTLLAMPEAKGLFHRAIAQSGGCNAAGFSASEGEDISERVFLELGIQKGDIEALRKISAYELVNAESKVWEEKLKEKHWPLTTPPYIDGEYILEHPLDLICKGAAKEVDLLVGTNLNESSSMKPDEYDNFKEVSESGMQNWIKLVMKTLGKGEDKAVSLINAYRETRKDKGLLSAQKVLDAFLTDFEFHISAIRTAEAQSVQNPNVYMYLFTWPSSFMDGMFGSFHTLEIPFVFGMLDDPFWSILLETSEEAKKFSEKMMDSWITFARTGNPSHSGIPEWPKYNIEKRSTMLLGKETKVVDDPYGKERIAWDGIM
ncbi:MAG: carboxylesterase/lipase family protein [Candidatus Lokiarchaeota archaeon]|nr:carboxylesterase/lipase family protein [Candidatus Lokiarchaeota archaeon]